MYNRWRMVLAGSLVLGVVGLGACSDETATGPMFGDLEFTPSFENIGSGRTIELILSNAGTVELGPILVGLDVVKQSNMPDLLCNSITVSVAPSSIASLPAGADATVTVTIDTSDVDPADCPPAQYDADVFASTDDRVLGGATIRFDWSGTSP